MNFPRRLELAIQHDLARKGRVRVGAPIAPTPEPPKEGGDSALGSVFGDAVKQITPTLLIVGIATGAAFAIGSGLVTKYLFKESRKR